jgi:hypothetical protein
VEAKMKESTKQILEILERAVEAERRFQMEYSRGASLAEDAEVKEDFLKLVDDEMEHERVLTERYRMLKGEPLVLEPEKERPEGQSRWEHEITVHTATEIEALREKLGLSPRGSGGAEAAILCDEQGVCFFDDSPDPNIEVLKSILNARSAGGWELVQLDYRADRLICTWKRRAKG